MDSFYAKQVEEAEGAAMSSKEFSAQKKPDHNPSQSFMSGQTPLDKIRKLWDFFEERYYYVEQPWYKKDDNIKSGEERSDEVFRRRCEERSDEAIQIFISLIRGC